MTQQTFLSVIFLSFLSFTIAPAQPDRIVIPFRTAGQAIVIHGTVDGRAGNLILDTGVAKMLLNQRHFEDHQTFTTRDFGGFQSVNGVDRNSGLSLVMLQLAELSTKTSADVVDLRSIELQKGMDILAVVGVETFLKFELEVDFFSEEIRLYNLDRQGNRLWQEPQSLPSVMLPFQYHGHVPCITANLHGQRLYLGLDTGAEFSVLASTIYESAQDRFPNVRSVKMLGLNGQPEPALATSTAGLQVGALEIPAMSTLFVSLNTYYGGLDGKNIHGLLGYPFFQHYRTAINFKKREVYLWDARAAENAPLAVERN